MLISRFAQVAELTPDTVRFYVRLGLLKPKTTSKGGSRPYLIFSDRDLDRAVKIRILQSLGYPLKEIGVLVEDDATGVLTAERSVALLTEQREKLLGKRDYLDRMIAFIDARITSYEDASRQPPDFASYVSTKSET